MNRTIRWRYTPSEVVDVAELQLAIHREVSAVVPPLTVEKLQAAVARGLRYAEDIGAVIPAKCEIL